MKAREPRRPVMLKARLRDAAGWRDACILNLSSRGLMVHSDSVPERGSILEVRRGSHVIVAQVMWSSSQRAGLKAQDSIEVDAVTAEAPVGARAGTAAEIVDRRVRPRRHDSHQASRERGRVGQYGSLALAALAGAAVAGVAVHSMLVSTLTQIAAVLG